ncbi:MAG TPA: hypothetical protein VHR45_07160 [Thermoanaerobaculia bacterium]|nr:hypothetical protein [Thermoanaerobaculia bacterium]
MASGKGRASRAGFSGRIVKWSPPGRPVPLRQAAGLAMEQASQVDAEGRAAGPSANRGEGQEQAAALVDRGWRLIHEGDPGRALPPLQAALAALEPSSCLKPWLRAIHGTALCFAELGRALEAELTWSRARPLIDRELQPADRRRVTWLEARVEIRSGRFRSPAAKLDRVLAELIAEGAAFDASLAALDLARLQVEFGQRRDLVRLAASAAPALGARSIPPRCRAVLAFVWTLVLRLYPNSAGLLESAADYLARARRCPELPFMPRREPLPEFSWDQMDGELRRQLCAVAGAGWEVARRSAAGIPSALQEALSRPFEELAHARLRF